MPSSGVRRVGEGLGGAPRSLFLIIACFTVLAVAYALTSPPFENPDEVSHAEYVAFLADTHRLPHFFTDCVRMAFHPPLYHLLLSPLAALTGTSTEDVLSRLEINSSDEAPKVVLKHGYPEERFPYAGVPRFVVLARLATIIPAVLVLCFTYKAATLFFARDALRVLAVATVAAVPQWQYLASSLNHDALAAACGAAFIYYVLAIASRPRVSLVVKAGIALGLGLLTKSSFVALVLVPPVAFLSSPMPPPPRALLKHAATLYCVAAAIAGWWYARNLTEYGAILPTVLLHQTTWLGQHLVRTVPIDGTYVRNAFEQLFESFWFLPGLMNIRAERWMYVFWALVTLVAIVGVLVSATRTNERSSVAALVLTLAGVLHYNLYIYSSQGRYLFIVATCLGLALARGFGTLVPRRLQRPGAYALATTLLAVSLLSFLRSFAPIYGTIGPRESPHNAETARLYCDNEYTEVVTSKGGLLVGLTLLGRARGSGDYRVDVTVQREGGASPSEASSVSSDALGRALAPVRFELPVPLELSAGERYSVTVRAPLATPAGRPAFQYLRTPENSHAFSTGRVPVKGILSLQEILDTPKAPR